MIRFATEEDIPVLLRMIKEFYNQTPYSSLRYDNAKTSALVSGLITNSKDESIVLVLMDKGGDVIGTLIAVITEPLCSTEKLATELVWWVDEGYRGRESIELLDAYEYWQKKVGCSGVSMASIQGGSDLDKFYKRRGYSVSELTYFKVN